jgi:5'-nucleotidase
MTSPRILISNDDGVHAHGLRVLAAQLAEVGEVWISAPDRERSATSHAISLNEPLRVRQVGEREFAVDGTPTDSVYVGLHHLMQDPPDIVVSGINHGPNLGNDVLYSGTVSAAMEGALYGYRAVAFSLCIADDRREALRPSDFAAAAEVARGLVPALIDSPMPPGVLLNVNVPQVSRQEIRGIKVCRLGYTDWADAVVVREDPRGKPYYWIGGDRTGHDEIRDSDNNAVSNGHVSVTPIHYDLTDYRSFDFARALDVPGFDRVPDELGSDPLPHPVHPRAGGAAARR